MLDEFEMTAVQEANRGALKTVVMLTFGLAEIGTPEAAGEVWKAILEGLNGGALALTEVERLQAKIRRVREAHCPHPSNDPAQRDPLCVGCSVSGVRVTWPCATWLLMDS